MRISHRFHPWNGAWTATKDWIALLFSILSLIIVVLLIAGIPLGFLYLMVKVIRFAWGS